MVWIESLERQQCASWHLLPLLCLEGGLALVILWRSLHQLVWKSHPRRVFFHLVLLASCGLRWFFWFALCEPGLLATGLAFLWWSNSLLLLCTASIVFQWASAVAAGRVTPEQMQQTKRLSVLHPLVFLHTVHLACSVGGGIDVLVRGLDSTASLTDYLSSADVFLVIFRVVNLVTVAVDAASAAYVALQLRARLLSAAMSDDMKNKSVLQMTMLIACISAALALQMVMDIMVLAARGRLLVAFGDGLAFSNFCVLEYLVPAVLLSLSFLYIMRRVEQRDPTRLVVLPAQPLVEFVECASPNCVWCAHHRRFHDNNQAKWDFTLLTGVLSPQTVDSSYRSAAHSSTHANVSLDSWSSSNDSTAAHDMRLSAHIERDRHFRLLQTPPPAPPPGHHNPYHAYSQPPSGRRGRTHARFG